MPIRRAITLTVAFIAAAIGPVLADITGPSNSRPKYLPKANARPPLYRNPRPILTKKCVKIDHDARVGTPTTPHSR